MESIVMTPEEAAAYLRVSRTRVYQLIHDGELKSAKDGKRRILHRDSVIAWAEAKFAAAG